MSYWIGLFLLSFCVVQDCILSLRLLEVRIPNYVIKGSPAQLECLYDLDGEALYSVKWYKDGNEFYRYVPRDMPPAQTFVLPGVVVDVQNSSDAIVTLGTVTLQSAGRFRCEVSGEAPSFQTVTEGADMVVVSLPDQGPPKITGGRPRYQVGDWVSINCTAGRSKPAVQLSWFVNGDPAEPHQLRRYETTLWGRDGLETSVLGLQFRVEQYHFRNGDMKLKCIASLSTLYWRSNEESVEGDRPQKAPVLESRETVYASNSRADPVQASKTDSLVVAHAPNLFLILLPATLTVLLTNDYCLKSLFLFVSYMLTSRNNCTRRVQCESKVQAQNVAVLQSVTAKHNNIQKNSNNNNNNNSNNYKTHQQLEQLLCIEKATQLKVQKSITDAHNNNCSYADKVNNEHEHNGMVMATAMATTTLSNFCENTLLRFADLMTENHTNVAATMASNEKFSTVR